jgi:hypothetical protein
VFDTKIIVYDDDREEVKLLKQMLHALHRIEHEIQSLHHYRISVRSSEMAISQGATGTFQAQLEDNGNPIDLPSGSTFSWSADDSNAQLAPSADTLSVVVSVPADDAATSITVTASTTAPDGSTVSGSVTVPVIPNVPHTFTVVVTQQ